MGSDNGSTRGQQPATPRRAEAFAAHFQGSFRSLWLIAVAVVGDRTLAEDIVQEAALTALTKFDQFKPDAPGSSFTAWMGQMVRYIALNARRKDRRQHTPTMPSATLDEMTSRPGRGLSLGDVGAEQSRGGETASVGAAARRRAAGELAEDQEFFDDEVVAALADVSEIARACLLLRTIEGLEYKEIALLMEIPEGTAASHVHRARSFLRQRLASMKPHAPSEHRA